MPAKRAVTTPAKKPAPHTIAQVFEHFQHSSKNENETFLNLRRYALEWNHERNSTWIFDSDRQNSRTKSLHPCRQYSVGSLTPTSAPMLNFSTFSTRIYRYVYDGKTHGTDSLYACIRLFHPLFRNASPANYNFCCFHTLLLCHLLLLHRSPSYTYTWIRRALSLFMYTTITSGTTKPNYITLIVVVFRGRKRLLGAHVYVCAVLLR